VVFLLKNREQLIYLILHSCRAGTFFLGVRKNAKNTKGRRFDSPPLDPSWGDQRLPPLDSAVTKGLCVGGFMLSFRLMWE